MGVAMGMGMGWWMLGSGCLITEVTISGPITDAVAGGARVEGASVVLRDIQGTRTAEATTDAEGWFSLQAPAGDLFFLVGAAEAEGLVATAYTGAVGNTPLEVEEGQIWLRRTADLEAIRATFSGCAPEVLDAGEGVVEGEVRLYVAPDQEATDLPLVTTARVTVYTNESVVYTACYLDDEGVSAPESEQTGETGRFAVFGVPEGPVSLQVAYDYGGTALHEDWYTFFVPGGGTVPLYPALAGMP